MTRPLVQLAGGFKLGCKAPVAMGPTFKLRHYFLSSLPDAPASFDYTSPNGSTSKALANVDLNASLGDCVIAWLAHQRALWTGNATGTADQLSDAEIVSMYSAIGGYVPGDPSTDGGCDPQTACNWIVKNGYPNRPGSAPLGWVTVDGSDNKTLRQAVWLFEGCGFGVGLPQAYVDEISSMKSGFTWDLAGPSVPDNGHMFLGCGANSSGIIIDTWGMLGTFTDRAIGSYAGPVYILLSADQIAKAADKAPNGFDWRALVTDFDALGGTVIVSPAPSPSPTPSPTPDPAATLTVPQAQTLVTNAFNAQPHWLLTRAQAIATATAALAAASKGS